MNNEPFKTYCFIAALRNCLEGDKLRDEERKALEETVEESFANLKVEYVGMIRLKQWYTDYRIRHYGIISERIDG